jgi:hypothetical protein
MNFLHLQDDNLVQAEAEVAAGKECFDCVKRMYAILANQGYGRGRDHMEHVS